jgi:hypothetical protein
MQCEIRRLEEADVPVVLQVIHDVRKDFGLERRIEQLLEPSDHKLFELYQRKCSAYFVALDGATPIGGAGIAPLAGADAKTCENDYWMIREVV